MWKILLLLPIAGSVFTFIATTKVRNCCRENEVWDSCANGGCRRWSCADEGILCIDPLKCEGGCVCRENYTRNDDDVCIPEDECDESQCCDDNEIWDSCANGGCRRWTCSIQGVLCIDPLKCEEGCVCQDNYARNADGVCIPEDQCDKCKKPNEIYSNCSYTCPPQTCDSIGQKYSCPARTKDNCIAECRCKNGYFRDANGDCVCEADCKKCKKPNEIYSNCSYSCPPQTCESLDRSYVCPIRPTDKCVAECRCKNGYYRNVNGDCVSEKDCRKCKKSHEFYSNCSSSCPPQTCDSIGKKYSCPAQTKYNCVAECRCQNGYFRDANGDCVSEKDCKKCKKLNEIYSNCSYSCPPQTCDSIGQKYACPAQNKDNCVAECRCKNGYFRDANGDCVCEADCKKCKKPNEIYSNCSSSCPPQTCESLDRSYVCPIRPTDKCVAECRCKNGYYRNVNGDCVSEKDCKKCPKSHEYYSNCSYSCPPQTCESIGREYDCPLQTKSNCVAECRCEKGYYRNANGDCVTEKDCKKCKKPNEIYSNCSYSCPPQTCDSIGQKYHCPLQTKDNCVAECRCKNGYFRDANGDCVCEADCKKCTKPNEIYSNCSYPCPRETCDVIGQRSSCPAQTKNCVAECRCKKEFYRNPNGECVTENDCKKCKKPHEYYSNCSYSCPPQTCESIGRLYKCPMQTPDNCVAECRCAKGYYRNANGDCVTEKDCKICKKPHEYFSNCSYSCPPQTCESIGRLYKCPEQTPDNCVAECRCAKGYYRNANGDCVTEKDCKKCKKPHEYFSNCSYSCPPQTCDSIGKIIFCPRQTCEAECRCAKGYYRNVLGNCVSEKDCKQCPGPNEYYDCGVPCDNVCAALDQQNQTNCPTYNGTCQSMCYCAPGYARNFTNICIPIDECPEQQCPDGEIYEECPDNTCEPLTCDQLGFPVNCDFSGNSTCPGPPGCICDNGLVRDCTGKCIPRDQCPSCGGDENAGPGCSNYCGQSCADYNKTVHGCPFFCLVNGCACKKGYVHDGNIGKCVLPCDCS